MRQLQLPLAFISHDVEPGGHIEPSPAEARILAELEIERQVGNLPTPEDRQRLYARLAADERRKVVEARRISH